MIKVSVPAKVNISLTVTKINGKFHDLSSVVVSANIYDIVSLKKAGKDQIITLLYASAQTKIPHTIDAMRKDYGFGGVEINSQKNIPLGGGLGGSSGVIAGVIRGINELYNLKLSIDKMIEYADLTGSDNAFMLFGGAGKIVGRSSVEDRFECAPIDAVIAVQGFSDTQAVFSAFDEAPDFSQCNEQEIVSALKERNIEKILSLNKNTLTPFSAKFNPFVQFALDNLAGSFMSGSGSAVVSLLQNDDSVIEKMVQNGYKIFKTRLGSYETKVEKTDE